MSHNLANDLSLTEPKVDLTDFGHFSGSGWVDFSNKSAAAEWPQLAPMQTVVGEQE
jgi:hypothetical protein